MKSVSILSIVGAVVVILGIAVVFASKSTAGKDAERFRGGSSGVALHYGGGGTGQPDSELGSSLY
jgi:uncharacterized membrane protein